MLVAIVGSSLIGYSGFADSLKLKGIPYHPSVPIIWAVTNNNALPKTIWVLKDAPKAFSQGAISNAMAMGSFKVLNMMNSSEEDLLHFQDNRDKTYMTRYLKMSPANGAIRYYNGRAEGKTITNVPTFKEAENLAVDYFSRLGGDTNQILPKPMTRTEGTVRTLDRTTGREGDPEVNQRGVSFYRQIHGIQINDSWFHIDLVSNAKVSNLEMHWRNLEDEHFYQVATPNEIINWIKEGKSVNPSPVSTPIEDINHAQKLTITKVTPYYLGESRSHQPQEFVYPFAEIEIIAETGYSKITFQLHCPIIDGEKGK